MENTNPTHYPNRYGVRVRITMMSKGYLKQSIEHVKRTQANLEYLPALEKELLIRNRPKLILLKP